MKRSRIVLFIFMVILAAASIAPPARAATESGYLSGVGDSDSFVIDVGSKDCVVVTFDYPAGTADFGVEVVGADGVTVIGNYNLDDTNVLTLTGGGVFHFTIYSNAGAGKWSADY